MIVGADTRERVFKPIEGKRLSQTITIVTDDGSLGDRGTVVDVLAEMAEATGTEVLYAAAPPSTLARIAGFCKERGIPAQVSVEERMACGLGLCQTCVVPVARKDGSGYDHLRSCVEGPVFNPARVVWDQWLSEAPTMLPTPPEGLPVVRSWPG
jgi:dihydroorotate dehydrogenase electron transfer subunit